jgi:NitT/TauT family transport system substrate-binding protein
VNKKIINIALSLITASVIFLTACGNTANNFGGTQTTTTSTRAAVSATTIVAPVTASGNLSRLATTASISTSTLVPPLPPGSDNKITLGYKGAACEPYFYTAIEKGIFKKYGLNVTAFKVTSNDPISVGKVDVSDTVLQSLLVPILNGMNIKFTIGLHQGCVSTIVKPDSTFNSWKDLKGKTIGLSGAIGTGTQLYAMRLILAEGVDQNKDVTWKPFPDQASEIMAFENGEIDAAVGGDRLNYLEVVAGKARWFSYMATDPLYQNESCCVLMFNGDFIKNHPEVARAFTAACYEATLWSAQNMDEAIGIEIDGKYVAGNYADNLVLQRTYPYVPGYKLAYDSIYNSIVDYKRGNVIDVKDPAAMTKSLIVYFDGIPQ